MRVQQRHRGSNALPHLNTPFDQGLIMKIQNASKHPLRMRLRAPVVRCLLIASAFVLGGAASGAPLSVPNGDFGDAANNGSVGGGLIGASGTQMIGSGPWYGSYTGVLGLLAPPVLTIAPGNATISSIAIDGLGIGNSGRFDQVLSAPWNAGKHYVLAADVTSSSLLNVDLLADGNAGLALMNGANVLNSTLSGSQTSLDDLGGNVFHVAIGFDSASSGGNIGVELFSDPAGVLAAHLLSSVSFRNVHLTEAPIPALPDGALASARGTPQAATIDTAFSAPLMVKVLDAQGNPLQGVTVTFVTPASGASINLPSSTAITDIAGIATIAGTANHTAGTYDVAATTPNAPQPATFRLTNSGTGQPNVTSRSSGNGGQSAITGDPFACMLAVQVISGSDPAAGATVVFQAPHSGASAVLGDGTNSGESVTATTDANGVASVAATANNIVGSFSVTATATSLSSGPLSPPVLLASYPLNNVGAAEQIFASGFEQVPANCGSFQ